MSDLFLTNERFLLAKWDYLMSLFRIVARDSRRADGWADGPTLTEADQSEPFDRHRTILMQTVSDLLDLEADLLRMDENSPAGELEGRWRELWETAAAWVREERVWRYPPRHQEAEEIDAVLVRRAAAEKRFIDVVVALWPTPAAGTGEPAVEAPTADPVHHVTAR